jgi:glycosyltransferase involved in cell wall biosynthesis
MRILFVDHTAGHNPKALSDKPTGGTLTSLTKVPEYLAAHGHEVYVRSTHAVEEVVNGVHYINDQTSILKWDVTVFNRNVLPREFVAYCKMQGSKIIWWLHDIVDPRYLPDDTFKAADKVVALSEYCKTTFNDFYGIAPEKFAVIPNGVDTELFHPGAYEDRNPNLYITASALVKGYMPLDLTLMNLKRHNPDVDFRIYSSQKLHGFQNTKSQEAWLEQMSHAGAHVYMPMSQQSLAHVMRKAWCLLMPNSYPEICSNLLLQARASGLPVVSSNIGANPEFLEHGETGLLTTKFHPHDIHSWTAEFTAHACRLYLDKDLHKHISERAPIGVKTWDEIGRSWNELIEATVADVQDAGKVAELGS